MPRMKILAIETSCEHASVALLIDDDITERCLEGHANHSERLLATLRELLAGGGLALGALDAVAFGAGPGAFTGLRLACGVAQGLAMGAGLGVAAVSSLEALALQSTRDEVLVLTDARMGEVYSAAYRRGESRPTLVQEAACTPPQAVPVPAEGTWFAMGSALRTYEADLGRRLAGRLSGSDPDAVPRAASVARIAAAIARSGDLLAPELAAPLYVRDKVALTTAERLARGGRA